MMKTEKWVSRTDIVGKACDAKCGKRIEKPWNAVIITEGKNTRLFHASCYFKELIASKIWLKK